MWTELFKVVEWEKEGVVMKKLQLPRLVSDGMILQQKKKVHILGYDEPGKKVLVSFLGEEYIAVTNEDGIWETWLLEAEPGGPHTMYISDESGNEMVIANILIGDVWICAGQSNMELPMERVKDRYPEELVNCNNLAIRTFKITEHGDFHAPMKELLTGEWKTVGEDTILQFSATAYFFAKHMYQMTGVPVGLINASLGGSRIESWMSAKMLEGYDEALETARKYADDEFVKSRILQNQRQMEAWHENLNRLDIGLKEHWETEELSTLDWKEVLIPFFFNDTDLKDFIGSVWFRRIFRVTNKMACKAAQLWLGTIVDSDTVYVNGVQVGHTDYQYPPRKYQVPEGVLREGENTIVIRVKCENGKGRFTADKRYAIWNEYEEVDLSGLWNYKEGASCEQIQPTDFVNWKPTGLYNGMLAPCCNYTIAGFLWYQGESNAHDSENYLYLSKRMIEGYRKNWKDEKLPFIYVQLPNFMIDVYDNDEDATGKGWPLLREQQRQILSVPDTGMAVAIDLGEDNDLHPLNKKDVGYRLAMLASKKLYGIASECEGPQVEEIVKIHDTSGKGFQVELYCGNITGGMYASGNDKGTDILDFELQDGSGVWYPASAEILGNKICLTNDQLEEEPLAVRYVYDNTNKGALIYNKEGYPMGPFVINI